MPSRFTSASTWGHRLPLLRNRQEPRSDPRRRLNSTMEMPEYTSPIHKDVISGILTAQQTHSCSFRAETLSDSSANNDSLQDYVMAHGVHGTIPADGERRLFGIGSGMKLIINFALYRLINDGREFLEGEFRGVMKDAWNKPAFELYNKLRARRGITPLWKRPNSRTPTVLQVMTHSYAFLAYPQGLFGPDGTFLMSEDTFGETFADIVDGASQDAGGDYCYSNWNTMLLGFIIKHATGKSLAKALKDLVLDELQMKDTVLDRDTYEEKNRFIVEPYVSTAELGTRQSSIVDFLDDDAALAVGGGFSCVEDMCKLLKTLLKLGLHGDKETMKNLFYADSTVQDDGTWKGSFLSGIYADLDSEATGSESFERLGPESVIHTLGRYHNTPIQATSKAGVVRGYACHFYIIPFQALVIAVMTNTSGIADSSQMIAQYIIQELLKLEPRLDPFEDKATEIFTKNREILRKNATCHQHDLGFSSRELEGLPGCFVEAITRQRVLIQRSEDGGLYAYVVQGIREPRPRRTSKMRLIKIAENVLAFSPDTEKLAIDAYVTGRTFRLECRSHEGQVHTLAKPVDLPSQEESGKRHASINEVYKRQNEWSDSWLEPLTP